MTTSDSAGEPLSASDRPARITAVVFDLGGVLIDWNPRHLYRKLFGADEAAMERFLAEICSPAWNARLDAGLPLAQGVAELVAAHPDQADLITAYHLRWGEMLGAPSEGTVAILRELRRAGLPTYALSNWSDETFPMTRARYPFLDEMDGILISGTSRSASLTRRFSASACGASALRPRTRSTSTTGIGTWPWPRGWG